MVSDNVSLEKCLLRHHPPPAKTGGERGTFSKLKNLYRSRKIATIALSAKILPCFSACNSLPSHTAPFFLAFIPSMFGRGQTPWQRWRVKRFVVIYRGERRVGGNANSFSHGCGYSRPIKDRETSRHRIKESKDSYLPTND